MDYQDYKRLFEEILNSDNPAPPYDNPNYLNYTKLNFSRLKRWYKTLQLDEELVREVKNVKAQKWIIITEPWCGDAGASLAFLVKLAEQNPNITYDIQLRDQEPFLIDSYLTNGGKSIPKLVVRDANDNDLFTWGPRPKGAQELVAELKAAEVSHEVLTEQVQNWYNKDKGVELQAEILQLLRAVPSL
ncbi:thioredoxin family protein [Fulvivirga sediminis]|uniref:Thioredoxin family protein n=1 Tax=Fulvivirga sediminis TaxID=2803949 RepID=A0A937F6B2_9BACT|nr:thioredoxin family protein [Fulvivirga sediminis]MBL3657186.1 thioredoxin family protein [Fulvivirga sediminis]